MIRVELGAEGAAGTRFVVSPLKILSELLLTLGRHPYALPRVWRDRSAAALAARDLPSVHALVAHAATGYVPDFISPVPVHFAEAVEEQLHRVATAPTERIGYEAAIILQGHPWCAEGVDGTPGRFAAMAEAIQRGERALADRAAQELEVFWKRVFANDWPRIQDRIQADIALRGAQSARDGLGAMVTGLAPQLRWRDGGIDLTAPFASPARAEADGLLLTPSLFRGPVGFAVDPPDAVRRQLPLITYPIADVTQARPAGRPRRLGATRAQLLQALAMPASTTEMARRLKLSQSTVSYHLQALYDSGLVQRTRQTRTVLYQRVEQ
ncbi:winged helix-turn-helix domain-containing protein [Yinghuangia seranimata]|uniref:winged helix-turn-helix domain-containing protein n=1 Tax=Yinghuangia seranimata TaxID=408067 RepID=UPI00248B089A|nr:winged helix-turn-helix domain-containing protein [Yinghuangia seranimata]MDI2130524.1 winged helix-turn-helix domain-containing protein [Yinghuangia seranimata]